MGKDFGTINMLFVSFVGDILLFGLRVGCCGLGGRRDMSSEALNPFEGLIGIDLLVLKSDPCQYKDAGCSLCGKGINRRDMEEFVKVGETLCGVPKLFVFSYRKG
jgi:hypothetical protein